MKFIGCLIATAFAASAAPVAALTLEGFEIPVLAEAQFAYRPAGSAWTFGGSSGGGIQRNHSGWGAALAPQGRQTAFLQGGDARISQRVRLPKGRYIVSFHAARRPYQANTANPVQQTPLGGLPNQALAPASVNLFVLPLLPN